MSGRRQVWAGMTRSAVPFVFSVLAVGLASGLAIALVEPSGAAAGLGAATLVATAVITLCALRPMVLELVPGQAHPLARAAGTVPPVLIRSANPDSPGRSRPRAPGCGCGPTARRA